MAYKPSQIFAAVLMKISPKSLKGDPSIIHKVFFDLLCASQDLIEDFKFENTVNPYSVILDNLITMFQLSGALTLCLPVNGEYFKINSDIVKKYLPSEDSAQEALLNFVAKADLRELCAENS